VAVVVHDADRVLLVRRRAERPGLPRWGIPAGFIEYDEDFLTAAHREVREEAGLEIELRGLANLSSNFFHDGLHALVAVLCAHAIGGTLRPGDDVDAVRWAPLRGPHFGLAFDGDRVALAALAEGRLPLLRIDPRFRRGSSCG
jgi:ADP-ribose pyrophosphatase YjhB (NUDIX family)